MTVFSAVLWFFSHTMVCFAGGAVAGMEGGAAKAVDGDDVKSVEFATTWIPNSVVGLRPTNEQVREGVVTVKFEGAL